MHLNEWNLMKRDLFPLNNINFFSYIETGRIQSLWIGSVQLKFSNIIKSVKDKPQQIHFGEVLIGSRVIPTRVILTK